MTRDPPQEDDVNISLLKMMRQPTAHSVRKSGGIPSKGPRDLGPLVLDPPTNTEGIELEIRSDSKTVVEWISGKAKQKTTVGAMEWAQKQLREWWSKGVDLR